MATYTPTLKTNYREQIVPALMKEFGYKSIMQVPRLQKIVVNQGMGQAVADKKLIEVAAEELSLITGQKAVTTKSRKDISNFKLRKGMPIGVMVTLRSDRMYESSKGLSPLPCRVSATSRASTRSSTARGTIPSVLPNR